MEGGSDTSRIRSLQRSCCHCFQTRCREGAEGEGRSEVQISNTHPKPWGSLTSGKDQDGPRVYFTGKLCRVSGFPQIPPFIGGKVDTTQRSLGKVRNGVWGVVVQGVCVEAG